MPFNAIRQQAMPSCILGISEATGDTHASVMTQLTPFVNRRMESSQMKVCVLREKLTKVLGVPPVAFPV